MIGSTMTVRDIHIEMMRADLLYSTDFAAEILVVFAIGSSEQVCSTGLGG